MTTLNDLEVMLKAGKVLHGPFPELGSKTAIVFSDDDYLYLFDREDGHLAWKYNRHTGKVEYECEHIRKGRRLLL